MTEADLLSDIDPVLLCRGDPNVSEATSTLWIYCAGPMRGIAEFNFPAFEAAAAQLRGLGYKVISPAEQDLGRGFDPTGLTGHEDMAALGFDLRETLLSDLKFVSECDAICLLPGWEFSKGATVELDMAVALGLRVGELEDYPFDEPMSEHDFLTGDLPAIIFPAEVRVTSETGGQKGTKLARFDLIPVQPLWAVAELYGYGTRKYADRNWERGYDWSLSYAAMQRHANLFWSREDNDAETGLPHLAAVAFHALALMEYARTHPEFDDRPEGSK